MQEQSVQGRMAGARKGSVGEGTRWTGAQRACMIMTEVNRVIVAVGQDAGWEPRNLVSIHTFFHISVSSARS